MRALFITLCTVSVFAVAAVVHGLATSHPHFRFDPPSVVHAAQAVYPPTSIASGTVILEVGLDNSGKIADVRVLHDIPSLTESAEQSLHQWQFEPARLEGQPVKSSVTVAFTFVSPNLAPGVR